MNTHLKKNNIPALACTLMAICCSFIIGCGGSSVGTVPVEGTIQYQGEPVVGIEAIFTPEVGSRPSTGSTDEQGHFVLNYSISESGVLPGKQGVTFDWEAGQGETMSKGIKAILIKHGDGQEPYMLEITKGVRDLVINIE